MCVCWGVPDSPCVCVGWYLTGLVVVAGGSIPAAAAASRGRAITPGGGGRAGGARLWRAMRKGSPAVTNARRKGTAPAPPAGERACGRPAPGLEAAGPLACTSHGRAPAGVQESPDSRRSLRPLLFKGACWAWLAAHADNGPHVSCDRKAATVGRRDGRQPGVPRLGRVTPRHRPPAHDCGGGWEARLQRVAGKAAAQAATTCTIFALLLTS